MTPNSLVSSPRTQTAFFLFFFFNQCGFYSTLQHLIKWSVLERSMSCCWRSLLKAVSSSRHPDADFIPLFPFRSRRARCRAFKFPAFCPNPSKSSEMWPMSCSAGLAPGENPAGCRGWGLRSNRGPGSVRGLCVHPSQLFKV